MSRKAINQHYVPRMYLKYWGHGDKEDPHVFVFRKYVESDNVPMIDKLPTNEIACWTHRYSPVHNGEETYRYEDWFDKKFENYAGNIFKQINECKFKRISAMSPTTKDKLLRFTILQMVRTPAYYMRNFEKMCSGMHSIITSSDFEKVVLEGLRRCTVQNINSVVIPVEEFRFKVSRPSYYAVLSHPVAEYKALAAREVWLGHIKRVTDESSDFYTWFKNHKWSIIEASDSVEWPTCDDPVVCIRKDGFHINEHSFIPKDVHEILFPLTPKHLLYTCVGSYSSTNGLQKNEEFSLRVWSAIFKNAFIEVYSKSPQEEMFKSCPRNADMSECIRVYEMIDTWHMVNSSIETEYDILA